MNDLDDCWAVASDEEVTTHLNLLTDTFKETALIKAHTDLEIPQSLWDRAYWITGEMYYKRGRYLKWNDIELRVYVDSRD